MYNYNTLYELSHLSWDIQCPVALELVVDNVSALDKGRVADPSEK
jgi:hypothetical protein